MARDPPEHLNVWNDRNTWFWYLDDDCVPQAHNYVFIPPLQSWRKDGWPFSLVTSSHQFPRLHGTHPPAPDILSIAPAVEEDLKFVETLGSLLRTRSPANGEMPSLEVATCSEGDEGVFPFLFRWRAASATGEPAPLTAESFMTAVGLNPVIAEETRTYIDFKARTFASDDERREATKQQLDYGCPDEVMHGECTGARAAWRAMNYHDPGPGPAAAPSSELGEGHDDDGRETFGAAAAEAIEDAAEEREYHAAAAAAWLPILERLCDHVEGRRLLVLTCGSQRILNPIPLFVVGETPSGNLVGLITGQVYT